MRRASFVFGLAVFTLGLVVATASAGGSGITMVKKTTTNTNMGPSTRTAECPTSDHVLGGGFSAPDGSIAQQTMPVGSSGWKAETLSSPGDSSAYALCEQASLRVVKTVSNSVTVPASGGSTTERAVVATCPNGWQVISGGYAVVPPFSSGSDGEIAVDTSMRTSTRTWKVHGGNDGTPTDLKAYAMCEKKDTSQIQQMSRTRPVTSATPVVSMARCPKGSHVVGGGFQIKPDESGGSFPVVNMSRPRDSQRWKTRLGFPSQSSSSSLTSFAECESG
jgi:hypothetical protein